MGAVYLSSILSEPGIVMNATLPLLYAVTLNGLNSLVSVGHVHSRPRALQLDLTRTAPSKLQSSSCSATLVGLSTPRLAAPAIASTWRLWTRVLLGAIWWE